MEKILQLQIEDILQRVKTDEVKFIRLQFTDLAGSLKCVTILPNKLEDAFEQGVWFDGSSIEGFARICESDMFLKPDAQTYAVLPWENHGRTARFFCDVFTPKGKPFPGSPRFILKKVMAEAREQGLEFYVGPEYEFHLFKLDENGKPLAAPHDNASYFDFPPRDLATNVRKDIVTALGQCGLEIETAHHEVGGGQHEIDFKYGNALATADNAMTLKHAVKSIAFAHGLHASFMPKPLEDTAGNGMHIHQSLFNLTGQNAFFDANDDFKLSQHAKGFIAGQLLHAKALSAILSPTINSYKRLVSGFEAPVYICWGQINRSALIRIPRYAQGREQSTRAEIRSPDPSCNPYLAFAVLLKTGLEGMKKKMIPPLPIEENIYHCQENRLKELNVELLPRTLLEALAELKKDKIIQEALGQIAFEEFLRLKEIEWQSYSLHVSSWEREKYLETV